MFLQASGSWIRGRRGRGGYEKGDQHPVDAENGKRVTLGEHAGLEIAQLELVQRQHELLLGLGVVLVPRQALGSQHEPEVLRTALDLGHAVVQAQVALADELKPERQG